MAAKRDLPIRQESSDRFFAALAQAGLPEAPQQFSVCPLHQTIPRTTLLEIETFIRVFDDVTTRPSWRQTVTAVAPEITHAARPEVCFFSAWGFHRPSPLDWQLIEFNDNGSGLLLAALTTVRSMRRSGWSKPRQRRRHRASRNSRTA